MEVEVPNVVASTPSTVLGDSGCLAPRKLDLPPHWGVQTLRQEIVVSQPYIGTGNLTGTGNSITTLGDSESLGLLHHIGVLGTTLGDLATTMGTTLGILDT